MAGTAKQKRNGPPPKYESKEQIIGLIEHYFEDCEGELLRDADGVPVLDKWSQPIYIGRKPPTIAGLTRALGFRSRQSLLNYQAKKEFQSTIEDAKLRIEAYCEERLFDKDGCNGARFSLACNFGWKEEKDEGEKAPVVNIINDIPKGSVTVNTDTAVFNPLAKPEDEVKEDAAE